MGHLTHEMGMELSRFQEEESTFKHQTFDFLDLGVEIKKLKNHLESYLESYLESHLEVIQKVM